MVYLRMSHYCAYVDSGRGTPCLSQRRLLQSVATAIDINSTGEILSSSVFVMLTGK